jgi:hypothetical protein
MDDRACRQISPCQSQDRLQLAKTGIAVRPIGRGCPFHSPRNQGLPRYPSQSVIASPAANCTERKCFMIALRNLPPDACIDDPAANLEPMEVDLRSRAFSLAAHGMTRIKEWATRGDVKQRALRHDLVTLCMCPQFLPCKRPSAAWCGRQHGVSRQYASRLQQEFTRAFGDHLQFRGQRFLDRARQ